jgi:hypothetical protein
MMKTLTRRRATGAAPPSVAALNMLHSTSRPIVARHFRRPLLSDRINLLSKAQLQSWTLADQQPRPTCVAFAAAACIELLRAGQTTHFTALSPQFLYWQMRMRQWPGDPVPGWAQGATKLGYAKTVLAENGICTEQKCRYATSLAPLQGPAPTTTAIAEAKQNRIFDISYSDYPDPTTRPAGIAAQLYGFLHQNRPVAISFPLFFLNPNHSNADTLNNQDSENSGRIEDPPANLVVPPDPATAAAHAVCVVGFEPDPDEPTGGWFIFRNSFGENWALAIDPEMTSPPIVPALGYGAISATYVERYCWEIFCPTNVASMANS